MNSPLPLNSPFHSSAPTGSQILSGPAAAWGMCVFAVTFVVPCMGLAQVNNEKVASTQALIHVADYPSLQAAVDALPPSGGTLHLTAAKLVLTEPVLIRAGDVTIVGDGSVSHVFNANTQGAPAFILSSEQAAENNPAQNSPIWRVQFNNFRLTGSPHSGHGIEARFVNEVFINSMTVSEHGGDGIHLHLCYEDPRVCNSLITYNQGAGVWAKGCHDTLIAGCQFEENRDAIYFLDGFNLTASGNNIDDHTRHGIVIENSMGNTLSGNMIEQCVETGVILKRDTYGTTVSSNIFTNDREGGVLLDDAHSCTLTGNTFSRVPKRAIAIDGKSHATTISGNTFGESSVGDKQFKGGWDKNVASGIYLDGAQYVNITGNTFSNLSTPALELSDRESRSVVFNSNLLLNSPSDHDRLMDSVVVGNLVRNDQSILATELVGTTATAKPPIPVAGQLRVATCQFPVDGDLQANAKWIRQQMQAAREQHADIAHFSEVALSGYAGVDRPDMSDYDWQQHAREFQSILDMARSLQLWVVLGSAHRLSGEHKPHNSLYVINDRGKVVDRYDKRFCTSGDLKHYSPGDHFVTFEIRGVRCGLLICYDIRFPELYRQYSQQGAQLIFHSFHNARQKPGGIHPKIMPPTAQARAATNGMFLSVNNSSAKHSWPSIFITPDGLIQQCLETDEPGIMVNLVDTQAKYYDASRVYRQQSISGILNSGEIVDDPRSKDRQGH